MLAILCLIILVHILNCPINTQRQNQGCTDDTYSQPGNDHAHPKRKKKIINLSEGIAKFPERTHS